MGGTAASAHGKHEARTGQVDPNWPDWYAEYMVLRAVRRRAATMNDYDVIIIDHVALREIHSSRRSTRIYFNAFRSTVFGFPIRTQFSTITGES
jgi:hypothetical protein